MSEILCLLHKNIVLYKFICLATLLQMMSLFIRKRNQSAFSSHFPITSFLIPDFAELLT